MPAPRLTYCGNVHPAEDLDAWLQGIEQWAAPVAAGQPSPFGLGVWWNAACAAELARDPARREQAAAALAQHRLEVWTLNAFPFGGFHAERVKTAVYRPDWADPRRRCYTEDAATAASHLAVAGSEVAISTLPLGHGPVDLRACAAQLRAVAQHLAQLEQDRGVRCVLALEPEPDCALETAAQTAAFLEDWVFARAAGHAAGEAPLRRHLGVCLDLCHLAVVGEDPVAALRALRRRAIAVPKVQVSSCLELREPAAALDALLAYDEPRYLHQTASDGGLRALDLGEVAARRIEFAAAGRLRTHFHVPVFWDAPDAALGSTRAEVVRFLQTLEPPHPLLEVETYTWTVLDACDYGVEDPTALSPQGSLVEGLRAELDFVRAQLPVPSP